MSLGDLLGLLFLLLFVLLPALQGLRRSPRPPPDASRNERVPKAKPKAPARPRPKPQEKAPSRSEHQKAKAPQEGEGRFSQPSHLGQQSYLEEAAKPQKRKSRLVWTKGNEVLKGVIWHEILKKPRGW